MIHYQELDLADRDFRRMLDKMYEIRLRKESLAELRVLLGDGRAHVSTMPLAFSSASETMLKVLRVGIIAAKRAERDGSLGPRTADTVQSSNIPAEIYDKRAIHRLPHCALGQSSFHLMPPPEGMCCN